MMPHCPVIAPSNGMLLVHSEAGDWIVPPTGVLKLMSGMDYALHKAPSVHAHVVMLPGSHGRVSAENNQLYRANGMVRELMATLGAGSLPDAKHHNRLALLADLLSEADAWPDTFSLRHWELPADPRVVRICHYVQNNLDSPRKLQEWAEELECDPRTLHRLFVREFGIPFMQWRQQMRLMAALQRLGEGRPVMEVALDLGYQTQSAFTAMFRRKLGITPSAWQEASRRRKLRAA